MSLWGKLIGGMAGFAVAGPAGAVMGAALGHAADEGALTQLRERIALQLRVRMGASAINSALGAARLAAMFGHRDQLFALAVVALSAKLAKCDGPVLRSEIDAFKRYFRIPPEAVSQTGRLFDQARDSAESPADYAAQLGAAFADDRAKLEDVLAALFHIARADGPVNAREVEFLTRVHRAFGLDRTAWEHARDGGVGYRGRTARADPTESDPYATLGVPRGANDEAVRAAWRKLMRENHPDSLASRGVPAADIARAGEKVARINAAWDRVKRERRL